MMRGSLFCTGPLILPSPDEIDDFHLVAVANDGLVERRALEHGEIELDGDAPRIDVQVVEEGGDGEFAGERVRLAVQRDLHWSGARDANPACAYQSSIRPRARG